ncbi:MAG: hypothetical protein SVT56_01800 [Chloroflexota bacterium]|nr:hypothetical protein [Chloroflexota bacterium]
MTLVWIGVGIIGLFAGVIIVIALLVGFRDYDERECEDYLKARDDG